MSHVAFPIVWAAGLLVFAAIMWRRMRLLVGAKPARRADRLPERLRRAAVLGIAQKKFLSGEQPAGIMHAFIFWGFVVLMLQVVTLFGRAFDAGWTIPGFGPNQPLGPPFFLACDLLEVTVIVAVLYMLYRRLVARTPRLFGTGVPAERRYRESSHREGTLILVLILLVMIGGLLYDAAHLVAYDIHGSERSLAPLTGPVASALGGLSPSSAQTVSEAGWWLHGVTILAFLILLPLSKHFHVITGIPNVFFGKLPPRSPDRPLAITQVPAAPIAAVDPPADGRPGVASLADLSWKHVLDAYSCTECGRCTAVCPAAASGSSLAPRQLVLDIRGRLYDEPGQQRDPSDAEPLIPQDVLWSCTTCMACVEECPVGIEHVPTIVDMRRSLVDQGEMDPLLQRTLENFGRQGNSYGKSTRLRARWTKRLDFEIPDARLQSVDYVWFVGDFASFDERVQRASLSLARILHDAGVSYGLLYEGERNAGNDVRRIGEEGLFELLVEQNLGALASAQFEAIFTTDPHSLNTLRNEYPQFGLDRPVYHYTELLADLIGRGALSLGAPLTGARVTYHDPCYLARYNRIVDAPRRLIAATGAELVEMPRHGTNTFCCGAGGGRIWMSDSDVSERPSEQRVREAQGLGQLDYFVVSCPKDLVMYSDAVKVVGADFEVVDVIALVERAIGGGSP